eukprot:MONOS_5937.1-p1 / transcript=MONOS_5937.1 / gene=MONOS_5937 / organism=Monocercomonoides_exilis_PA203 / gene_product=Ubiquitin-like modifier-activating enzyme 1 D (Uba1D) / transcript_product=Ubiquitin-like modifier-activating enzyme 1 D (Uba1D) / location=Mono_scaffold00179:64313-68629(+) / protein_length=1317 / sequence_SO=supercontig / SO=protein_coding / is_pseudo=false
MNEEQKFLFHDRQSIAYGQDSLNLLSKASVLVSGLKDAGIEIGVGSIVLHDPERISLNNFSSSFCINENKFGQNRAEYFSSLIEELCIMCRRANVKIVMCDVFGIFSRIFVDFGDHHKSNNWSGEKPRTEAIMEISHGYPAIVTFSAAFGHSFQNGCFLCLHHISGMEEANGKIVKAVAVDSHSVAIDLDTTSFGTYKGDGYATTAVLPLEFHHRCLTEELEKPTFLKSSFRKSPNDWNTLHVGFEVIKRIISGTLNKEMTKGKTAKYKENKFESEMERKEIEQLLLFEMKKEFERIFGNETMNSSNKQTVKKYQSTRETEKRKITSACPCETQIPEKRAYLKDSKTVVKIVPSALLKASSAIPQAMQTPTSFRDKLIQKLRSHPDSSADFSSPSDTQLPSFSTEIAKVLIRTATGSLAPIVSCAAGIAAQEAIKAITMTLTPITQWLYLSHHELMLDERKKEEEDVTDILSSSSSSSSVPSLDGIENLSETECCKEDNMHQNHSNLRAISFISFPPFSDCQPLNTRYDSQASIIGWTAQETLMNLRVFQVGCGATGCEMLKQLAMMGVGCGERGRVTVTDMDGISLSNLSRQFLFQKADVNKMKAEVAAEKVLKMNPDMHITALTKMVGEETADFFNSEFWSSIDLVITTPDNVEVRNYVSLRCTEYLIPMFDCGTLGLCGTTMTSLPFRTETYRSANLGIKNKKEEVESGLHDESGNTSLLISEGERAMCTPKEHPFMIEHVVNDAKELFEQQFQTKSIQTINSFLKDPKEWIKQKKEEVLRLNEYTRDKIGEAYNLKREIETIIGFAKENEDSFDDCIRFGRKLFDETFVKQPQQQLIFHPTDEEMKELDLSSHSKGSKLSDFELDDSLLSASALPEESDITQFGFRISSSPFWREPRRVPLVECFDPSKQDHLCFVGSAAILRFMIKNKTKNVDINWDRVKEVAGEMKTDEFTVTNAQMIEKERRELKNQLSLFQQMKDLLRKELKQNITVNEDDIDELVKVNRRRIEERISQLDSKIVDLSTKIKENDSSLLKEEQKEVTDLLCVTDKIIQSHSSQTNTSPCPQSSSALISSQKSPNQSEVFDSVHSLSFDKDESPNHPLDFITCAANLKAKIYHIPQASKTEVKIIVGRIIPAVITTTATISALGAAELIPFCRKTSAIDAFHVWFINQALNVYSHHPPYPPRPLEPGSPFTEWNHERLKFGFVPTIKQLVDALKEKYSIEPILIKRDDVIYYQLNDPSNDEPEYLDQQLTDILWNEAGEQLEEGATEMTFILIARSINDEHKLVRMPLITVIIPPMPPPAPVEDENITE